ncbi:unnamed protein product [Closterium sp. NIES-54]
MVTTTTPGGQRVSLCTCTRTGRHLATFTRRSGSSLYTLATEPPQVAASAQGHPSLPRLRGMHSRLLCATPHSSSFPPTTAPLQTLHMDVWGPARVSGHGRKRYFLLVVEDYTRYTTVFPLRSKGQVVDVLIPWIRTVRLQLRERFCTDLPVLRLHSDRGGEFSSDLLRDFCRREGILQSFTLPESPHQNGIAERRIGLVMQVARTSMIHAAAPHFLWPFGTSPTLRWTGKVGDASVFRVWGSCAFVRDTSADKLFARAIPCVFLGFVPDPHGWQFYHPTTHRVLPSQNVTFDESVPFYRLFPYRSAPLPPPPIFLAPCPPPVDPLRPQGPTPSGVSRVDPPPGAVPSEVAVDSSAARGAASGGAETGGAELGVPEPGGAETRGVEPGGNEPWGAETGGAEPGGAETGGAQPEGAETGGAAPEGVEPGGAESEGAASGGAEPQGAASSGGFAATGAGGAGATGARGTRVTTGAGVTGGSVGTGPGGARTLGTGAAEAGGVGGTGAGDPTEFGAAGAGGSRAGGARTGGTGAGGAGVGGTGAGGAGTGGAGAVDPGGAVRLRPYFVPLLQQPGGLTERCEPASHPVLPNCTAPRVTRSCAPPVPGTHAKALRPSFVPLRVPLPAPPESSLPEVPDPESDIAHAASPTVSRLLATSETAPSFDPLSVADECALGTDVLEDRQEDFECLAAAAPRFASMLLALEGYPDAPDIPTPRSYAEAITGPYSS